MPRNENEIIQTERVAAPPLQAAVACVRQAARAAQKCATAARVPTRHQSKRKKRARRKSLSGTRRARGSRAIHSPQPPFLRAPLCAKRKFKSGRKTPATKKKYITQFLKKKKQKENSCVALR